MGARGIYLPSPSPIMATAVTKNDKTLARGAR